MIRALAAFLKTTRWVNLGITLFTLIIAYFLLLNPILEQNGFNMNLDILDFVLLCLSVLFIMAGGYLVNDIEDEPTDAVNEKIKDALFVHSINSLYGVYFSLTATGLVLGLLLSWLMSVPKLWSIHLASALLLFLYAIKLKGTPLAGNLIIAILCAIVPLLPLIFATNSFTAQFRSEFFIFNYLSIYAFTATAIREMVKDLEDVKGDASVGMQTLPVVFGSTLTKAVITLFIALFVILNLACSYYFLNKSWICTTYLILANVLPVLWISNKILRGKSTEDFAHLSKWLKFILISGHLFSVLYFVDQLLLG